jgi:hypothetical protein
VQAETENISKELTFNKCFTIVVFPDPDGAQKIITFPSVIAAAF